MGQDRGTRKTGPPFLHTCQSDYPLTFLRQMQQDRILWNFTVCKGLSLPSTYQVL